MTGESYNVQCLNGHVFYAVPGSDLEAKCIARVERGYLDALCLSSRECPKCLYEQADLGTIMADRYFGGKTGGLYEGQVTDEPPAVHIPGVFVNGEPLVVTE